MIKYKWNGVLILTTNGQLKLLLLLLLLLIINNEGPISKNYKTSTRTKMQK